MNNKQIALRFFEGATSGKGSNMFIEGDTIFSYGYYFKIAVRVGDFYLFNSNSYSHSTGKHQSYVRGCLPSNLIIECPDCDISKAEGFLINTINSLQEKQEHARKMDYSQQIANYTNMLHLAERI